MALDGRLRDRPRRAGRSSLDTGPGHSISAFDVRGGKGYAAWCGPCWPGYVSETGFARGLIANTGAGWKALTLPASLPDPLHQRRRGRSGRRDRQDRVCDAVGLRAPLDDRSGRSGRRARLQDDQRRDELDRHLRHGRGHLVDAPANDVEVVGNRLVVATDVGVYVSSRSGGTWARVGNGLPNVVTADLSVTPDGRLLAATHGRGMWAIPLAGLS